MPAWLVRAGSCMGTFRMVQHFQDVPRAAAVSDPPAGPGGVYKGSTPLAPAACFCDMCGAGLAWVTGPANRLHAHWCWESLRPTQHQGASGTAAVPFPWLRLFQGSVSKCHQEFNPMFVACRTGWQGLAAVWFLLGIADQVQYQKASRAAAVPCLPMLEQVPEAAS